MKGCQPCQPAFSVCQNVIQISRLCALKGEKLESVRIFYVKIKINSNCGNMKIDELPVETLMKIFSYLKKFNKVLLVNKQFYDVALKVKTNFALTLERRIFVKKKKLIIFLCSTVSSNHLNFNRKMRILQCWRASNAQTGKYPK